VTRPTATQDPSHPPAPQDCGNSGCHTTAPPFQGGVKPSNHIASSATCTNCHTGYTPATTTMNHADSVWAWRAPRWLAPPATATGPGPYYGTAQGRPEARPLASRRAPTAVQPRRRSTAVGTAACSICHKSTIVPGGFKGTTVPHTNGPFMTYTRGSAQEHTGRPRRTCNTCHGAERGHVRDQPLQHQDGGPAREQHRQPPTASTATADRRLPAAAAAAAGPSPGRPLAVRVRPAGRPSVLARTRGRAGTNPSTDAAGGHRSVLAPGCCAGQLHELPPPGRRRFCDAGRHLADHVVVQRVHPRRPGCRSPTARGASAGCVRSCHAVNGKWATPKPAHTCDGPLVRCVPPQTPHRAAGDVRPPEPRYRR